DTQSSQTGPAPNDRMGAVRHALQTAYAQAGEAWRARDAAALMQMGTSDFTQNMPDGQTISPAEAQAATNERFAPTRQVTRYTIQIESLALNGPEAIATVDEQITMTFADPAGKPHVRDQSTRARMIWIETPDGWRIRQSDYLTASMKVDGVKVPPLGVPGA